MIPDSSNTDAVYVSAVISTVLNTHTCFHMEKNCSGLNTFKSLIGVDMRCVVWVSEDGEFWGGKSTVKVCGGRQTLQSHPGQGLVWERHRAPLWEWRQVYRIPSREQASFLGRNVCLTAPRSAPSSPSLTRRPSTVTTHTHTHTHSYT